MRVLHVVPPEAQRLHEVAVRAEELDLVPGPPVAPELPIEPGSGPGQAPPDLVATVVVDVVDLEALGARLAALAAPPAVGRDDVGLQAVRGKPPQEAGP